MQLSLSVYAKEYSWNRKKFKSLTAIKLESGMILASSCLQSALIYASVLSDFAYYSHPKFPSLGAGLAAH